MGKKPAIKGDTIRVVVRFRPQNSLEKKMGGKIAMQVSPDGSVARMLHPKQNLDFVFDRVFNFDSTQPQVYKYSVSHMIEAIMQGFNSTVFAYGQTGSGKTYSMEGSLGSPNRGIVPRLVEHLFEAIEEADEIFEFVVKVSYVEIYLEKLRDLLRPSNGGMKIRESKHGVYIQGVTEMYVREREEVINLMELGSQNRTTNCTNMNAVSSRSHGVFSVKLITKDTTTGATKMAKLMMVDLAGSEKVRKTAAVGRLLEEAKKINQSLSCLGSVMNALSEGNPFVPYRDSVLTRLLSDSLGGNCKTTLLICASCSNWNIDESISTLRFGTRAKKVTNKAKVNAEKTVAEYKRELNQAKAKINSLSRLVLCLKRDLKNACAGKLTNPEEGDGARLEAGEDLGLPSDEEKLPKKKTPKKDPWASPAKDDKSADEEELIEGDGDDDDDDNSSQALESSADEGLTPTSNESASPDQPKPAAAQHQSKETENPPKQQPKKLSDLTMDDVGTGDDNVVSIAEIGDMVSKSTEQQQRNLPRSGSSRKSVTVDTAQITELVSANDSLSEKVKDLRQHSAKLKTDLMMKTEALIQEKEKTENAEMDYERISLESRSLMDESMSLKYERERLTRERDDLQAELDTNKEDLILAKGKLRNLEESKDDAIELIRDEERSKVDEFISKARAAIADRAPVNSSNKSPARSGGNRFAPPGSQNISPEVELQQMKLDRVKLEQTLQQKVQEYVTIKLKAFESVEKCKKLEDQVRRKDQRLRGQHNELVGLGQLKSEADKYHHETAIKLEKSVKKLKKENVNLNKQLATLRAKQRDIVGGGERDEAGASVKKKLKSMVMPIRGGGNKKKHKKKKKNHAAPKRNNLQPVQQYNYGHAKSPSMMSTGFYSAPPQQLMYQPQYDQTFEVGPPVNDGFTDLPEIPSMVQGGVPYYNQQQNHLGAQMQLPHGRNNTFVEQTNFWAGGY